MSDARTNVNSFIQSLAMENRTSQVQAQLLLARKLAERQRCLRKMRNIRDRMRRLARQLTTEEVNMATIEEDARRLKEADDAGVDDDQFITDWQSF
jgi:hypothetical protein